MAIATPAEMHMIHALTGILIAARGSDRPDLAKVADDVLRRVAANKFTGRVPTDKQIAAYAAKQGVA